jgi:hypothetical protein
MFRTVILPYYISIFCFSYEQLLDEAQRRAEGLGEEDSLKEAKKLRPGDVDPTPETKPARPGKFLRLYYIFAFQIALISTKMVC